MFCGAKYTHHTFTPIIKHLITTTANKHPGKKSFIDTEKHEENPTGIRLCIPHKIKLPLPEDVVPKTWTHRRTATERVPYSFVLAVTAEKNTVKSAPCQESRITCLGVHLFILTFP